MSNKEDPEKALETMDDGGEGAGEAANVASQLMRNPQVLAALQGRLDGMIGSPSGYIEVRPPAGDGSGRISPAVRDSSRLDQ